MPDGRKPFSVAGGCEPGFIARALQQSEDTRKNAHYYFENRADFVQKYRDEIIFLSKGNVFFHEKVAEGFLDKAFQSLDAAKLDLYEVYSKLVQAEEAELLTPYE